MRVIILAADSGLPGQNIPKCLLKLRESNILEHQIALLKGIGLSDIVTVVGVQGDCWNQEVNDKIKSISPKIIINKNNLSTKSGYSLYIGSQDTEGSVLVLDGDLVIDEWLLRKLVKVPEENVLILRPALSISEPGGKVSLTKNKVVKAGKDITEEDFPWDIYSGVMKLNSAALKGFRDYMEKNPTADILDSISEVAKNHEIYGFHLPQKEEADQKVVIGGSHAKVQVKRIIRKEVSGFGKQKLIEEINWINSLPEDVKEHFPKIKEYNIGRDIVYSEQPYYEMPSLRDLLFNRTIDSKKALQIVDEVFKFLFEKFYYREKQPTPPTYLDEYHFKRNWYRYNKTEKEAPIFKKIIPKKRIELNGEVLINAPILLKYIETNKNAVSQLTPEFVTKFVHGDLHFENILVDLNTENFILLDPRGYKYCDFYYDFGKISHSINGLYDFLHEDRFNLKWTEQENKITAFLEFPDSPVLKEYNKIRDGMVELYKKHSKNEKAMKHVIFNEAMHFCSMMPFHLAFDGKEARAISIYLTGVKLLNDFIKDNAIDFIYSDWVNVNTLSEYEKAKDWNKSGG